MNVDVREIGTVSSQFAHHARTIGYICAILMPLGRNTINFHDLLRAFEELGESNIDLFQFQQGSDEIPFQFGIESS